jgi:hypothetical protein
MDRTFRTLARRTPLMAIIIGCVGGAAVAQKQEPAASGADRVENRITFSTGPAADAYFSQLQERLADPVQRAELRAKQREQMVELHSELAAVVGLNGAEETRLVDILTDEQMAAQDGFGRSEDMQKRADEDTRRLADISALLGEKRFARYQEYMDTLGERRVMQYFDSQLDAANKLSPEQKTRLMPLYRETLELSTNSRRPGFPESMFGAPAVPAQQRERVMLEANVALNEEGYRRMQASSAWMAKQVVPVLTPPQRELFERLEAKKIDSQRRYVEQLRVSAGMSAEIPVTAPPGMSEREGAPLMGRVRIALSISANGKTAAEETIVIENGSTTEIFEGPEGLSWQATPTLLEDGMAYVSVQFFENTGNGRRPIRGDVSVGSRFRMPDGNPMPHGGGGGGSSTIKGAKAYVVTVIIRASPM